MRHQDHGRNAGERTHADDLFRALQWITAKVSWLPLPWRAECTWTTRWLAFAALLWAWSDEKTLTDRFQTARKIICRLRDKQDQPATTYQAFIKLLGKWTDPLRELLTAAFQQQAQASLARVWRVAGWSSWPSMAAAWMCRARAATNNATRPAPSSRAQRSDLGECDARRVAGDRSRASAKPTCPAFG